jgi:hypothetical protein
MDTKICNSCKKELPNNLKFFRRKRKQDLYPNSTVLLLNRCRVCCYAIKKNKAILSRCAEMGCEVKDYKENWKKQRKLYKKRETKYPEIAHLSVGTRQTLREWIRNGYVFSTYEQYKIDTRRKCRKYYYENDGILTKKECGKVFIENMPDSYIANVINRKVNEIPKEIIETKRIILKLKRELILK